MSTLKASGTNALLHDLRVQESLLESPFADENQASMTRINGRFESEQSVYDNPPDARDDILTESDSDSDYPLPPKKEKTRKPNENNFQQQKLKAVNPVITAKYLIPIFLGLGVFLLPLGGAMWLASQRVQDFTIDYSQCENLANYDYWLPIPDKYTKYQFSNNAQPVQAQWKLDTNETQQFDDEKVVCKIQFNIPHDLKSPLYFFYHLDRFSQNHRRYAKSFSEDQIEGKRASVSDIKDTTGQNCQPLSVNDDGVKYYPCGLIANSMFNDTFTSTLSAVNGTSDDYVMSRSGIAWSHNSGRYKKTKYNYTEIVPPPNWYKWFPDGYNETNVPDISTWEDFQNWMTTSALQHFNKLYMKNENEALKAGTYEVSVGLHFPVLPYDGKKKIFISQRSAIGGKNYFLGYSWIACGSICVIMGIFFLVVNVIKPRKPGDDNLLSWNREKMEADSKLTPEEEATASGLSQRPNLDNSSK